MYNISNGIIAYYILKKLIYFITFEPITYYIYLKIKIP